jgi:hypothetical protein
MSGGHAFSNSDIDTIKSAGSDAVVEFVTHKTLLRPEAGFDVANAKDDLEAAGYVVAENEVVLCSAVQCGRVAVMAVSAKCVEAISALGIKVRYTSPLLSDDDITEGSHISLYDDVLYVRVYKSGLRFAEAMVVENDADLLFYLESINRVYGIYNMYARAIGDVERLNRAKCFKTKF